MAKNTFRETAKKITKIREKAFDKEKIDKLREKLGKIQHEYDAELAIEEQKRAALPAEQNPLNECPR